MNDLNTKIHNTNMEIEELARPHLPMGPMFYKFDYNWGCKKSPFGWCAYDHYKDGAHDFCVFCNEPQERK